MHFPRRTLTKYLDRGTRITCCSMAPLSLRNVTGASPAKLPVGGRSRTCASFARRDARPGPARTLTCGANQGLAAGRKNVGRRCARVRSFDARATSVGVDAAVAEALSLAATPAWQDPGENGRPPQQCLPPSQLTRRGPPPFAGCAELARKQLPARKTTAKHRSGGGARYERRPRA